MLDFLKRKSPETKKIKKIDLLKEWCSGVGVFSTTDVKRWGLDHFYSSADVRVRIDLKNEGFVRQIPDDEARERHLIKEGNKNIRWYEIVK